MEKTEEEPAKGMTSNGAETPLSLSTLSPFPMAVSRDLNKYGSVRMRRVLEKCLSYYWWHHVNALNRAETIQRHLPPEDISLIRMVQLSRSDQRIFTSPLSQFIRNHHPGDDRVAVLEDETGREFKVDFFNKKWSLSRGWKELCAVHKLVKGDYLVFHLVQPSKFEVYVAKQTYEDVVDKTTTLSIPGGCLKENVSDKETSCAHAKNHPRKENSTGPGSQIHVDTSFGASLEDLFYAQNTLCFLPSTVSQNPEKTESCKKMRKAIDKSSDSVIAWSPQAMEYTKQDYIARAINSFAADKAPIVPNCNDCWRQNDSGRVNGMNVVDRSPIETNFDSSTRIIELENQRTFEKPNAQSEHAPLSFSLGNIEASNSFLVAHSHPRSNLILLDEDVKPSQIVPVSRNFKIVINGIDISSEIPEHTLISYSSLCHTRSSLLHTGLTVGNNLKHAIFIISETVHISDAIKNCNVSTHPKEIVYWSKSLESFSTMGMDVGFMRERVNRLLDLTMKKAVDREKDEEAKAEGEKLEEKIHDLELEIEKAREKKRKIDNEREGNRKKAEEFEAMIKREAGAPW